MAIALVVVFHAAPTLVGGGYIGVDVFFVISGFLITGLLVSELQEHGRISLGSFYARRVRRLLPAAVLAIGATLLLSALILPPLDASRVAVDGIAAALSVANIRFALEAGDYFTALRAPSPFLHYWSLSVEEQFYLIWPATLIVAFMLGRSIRAITVVVAAVAVISLAAAVILTDSAPNWAFFSLPTRAWQLALGGLLAIMAIGRYRGSVANGSLAIIGWLGLAAVVIAGIWLDETLAYPGLWALIPTLGAVALIAGGDRRFGPGWLLSVAPMRFLGRISYALYLWHWPLLVLPAVALGEALAPGARFALVVLAIVVATASTLYVEEPIRGGSGKATGRRQLAVVGALGMALLVSVTMGVGAITWVTDSAIAESRQGVEARAAVGEPLDGDPEDDGPADAIVQSAEDLDADEPAEVSIEPRPTPTSKSTPKPTPKPKRIAESTPKPKRVQKPKRRPEKVVRLPANVKPTVWDAPEDEEALRKSGCLQKEEDTRLRDCVYDPGRSRKVIALVGDSHASHWYPALRAVARDRGWRLVTFVKVSCPFVDIAVQNLRLKREYWECARFNENAVAALKQLKPDLVVTSLSRWQHPKQAANATAAATGASMARMLNRVPGRKVVLADVPYPGEDVPSCLSANIKDIRRCAVPAANRSSGGSPTRERIAAKRSGGTFIDFGDVICGGGACPVVNNNRIIFRDDHHMTATFAKWLAPALDRALQKVLKKR